MNYDNYVYVKGLSPWDNEESYYVQYNQIKNIGIQSKGIKLEQNDLRKKLSKQRRLKNISVQDFQKVLDLKKEESKQNLNSSVDQNQGINYSKVDLNQLYEQNLNHINSEFIKQKVENNSNNTQSKKNLDQSFDQLNQRSQKQIDNIKRILDESFKEDQNRKKEFITYIKKNTLNKILNKNLINQNDNIIKTKEPRLDKKVLYLNKIEFINSDQLNNSKSVNESKDFIDCFPKQFQDKYKNLNEVSILNENYKKINNIQEDQQQEIKSIQAKNLKNQPNVQQLIKLQQQSGRENLIQRQYTEQTNQSYSKDLIIQNLNLVENDQTNFQSQLQQSKEVQQKIKNRFFSNQNLLKVRWRYNKKLQSENKQNQQQNNDVNNSFQNLVINNSNEYSLSSQAEKIIKKYSVKNKDFSNYNYQNKFNMESILFTELCNTNQNASNEILFFKEQQNYKKKNKNSFKEQNSFEDKYYQINSHVNDSSFMDLNQDFKEKQILQSKSSSDKNSKNKKITMGQNYNKVILKKIKNLNSEINLMEKNHQKSNQLFQVKKQEIYEQIMQSKNPLIKEISLNKQSNKSTIEENLIK